MGSDSLAQTYWAVGGAAGPSLKGLAVFHHFSGKEICFSVENVY